MPSLTPPVSPTTRGDTPNAPAPPVSPPAEALRQREERYHTLFDTIDQGFCEIEVLFDEQGEAIDYVFLTTNPAFAPVTGLADVIGRRMRDLAPDHEAYWFETYGRVARTGIPERFEAEAAALGHWYNVYAFPVGDPAQHHVGILFEDITTRKHAEERLRASEERYRTLFAKMDQGLCVIEKVETAPGAPSDFQYLEANPAFLRHTGLQVPVGKTILELVPTAEPEIMATYDRVVATGKPEQFAAHVAGIDLWMEAAVYPAQKPGQLAVLFTNITARKQAEAALRASEARQVLLLQVTDAIRHQADPMVIRATATHLLAAHLGVDRAMYAEIEGETGEEQTFIRGQFVRQGNPFPDRVPYAAFADGFAGETLLRGEAVVVTDTTVDPRLLETVRATWLAAGVAAQIAVPLVKHGRVAIILALHSATPRTWTSDEIALVHEVAERTWTAVEWARAEAALRESEKQYRTLFTTMEEGFARYRIVADVDGSPQDVKILEINPAYERLMHRQNPLGQRLSAVDPGLEGEWLEVLAAVARSGHPHRFERYNARLDRWFDVRVTPLPGDDDEVVLVFSDITERRRSEKALRESEERSRLIVEQATDYAIFTTDCERRIDTWPPGAAAVYGWSPEEALGQVMDVTYTPEDRALGVPEQEFAAARAAGHTPNVRWHQRRDGTRVFIEGVAYARWTDDGAFQGVFKIGQDITARLEAEAARRDEEVARREEEIRLREDLAEQVRLATTDLRNLSRRLLLVQEEERRKLALELHDEVGQVLTGLTFQLAVVGGQCDVRLLHEAQATVGALTEQVRQLSLDLRPAVLDHFGLVAALEWHVARFQAKTGISVHLRLHGLDGRFASEVEIAAFRVVQEALTNVARHAGADFVTVQVYRGERLALVIRDSGRGFDPTQVVDTSGLGGMRERVDLLGGTLDIESTPGQGTVIIAELPLDDHPDITHEPAKDAT